MTLFIAIGTAAYLLIANACAIPQVISTHPPNGLLHIYLVNSVADATGIHSGWFLGILLGEAKRFPHELIRAGKDLGLYHLFVVSGMHISFVCRAVGVLFGLPLRLLYAALQISPTRFAHLSSIVRIFSLLVSWLFLSVIGFPVAAVRAGLTSTITTMANIYFARGKFGSSLALGVFCHALLMPQGVLSLSAILSWSAYAIVSANSTKRGFMAVLWMQITMIMFCAGMFGAFSPLAILMNLVAIPLFPPLFVSAWLVLIPGPWQEPIIVVHGFAQDAILMAHDWALEQQLLWENIPTTIRVVMLTIACYNLLRVSWLSLEDEESDGGGKNNPNSG